MTPAARAPQQGEVLKLGPPASGEIIIVVDPGATGAAYAAGTETLLSGAEIPVHKCLEQDRVLFIHKGQGRATLNEQIMVVLPGAMLYVPRGVWYGLRNTGTGALQIAWASAPGVEAFFRDLSRLGASPSAPALQELAQRHRIEFRPATAVPMPSGPRHRGRRGGRRHRSSGRGSARTSGSSAPSVTSSPARAEPSSAPAVSPSGSPAPSPTAVGAPRGRPRLRSGRHHRRGGGGRSRSAPPAVSAPATEPGTPRSGVGDGSAEERSSRPVPSKSSPTAVGAGRSRSAGRPRSRRVKEVYMGGRWVQVEGGAPVIAPGRARQEHRRPKQGGEDEPPYPRLSVPL